MESKWLHAIRLLSYLFNCYLMYFRKIYAEVEVVSDSTRLSNVARNLYACGGSTGSQPDLLPGCVAFLRIVIVVYNLLRKGVRGVTTEQIISRMRLPYFKTYLPAFSQMCWEISFTIHLESAYFISTFPACLER